MAAMLGLDLGGTHIKSGLISKEGNLSQLKRTATPNNDPTGEKSIALLAEICSGYSDYTAVGLAVPGLVDVASGVCIFSGTLGWRNVLLVDQLQQKIAKPVFLEHDLTAGGLAELKVGSATGLNRGVVIAIGTALAAALIIDGKVYHPHPSVGEIGHAPLPNDRSCVCGKSGCVEMTVSGGALSRNYLALTGESVEAKDIISLAESGSQPAAELFDEFIAGLGFVISWLSSALAPEVIVIAGGLAASGNLIKPRLAEQLDARLGIQLRPDIRFSNLGGNSGCIGAGLSAFERYQVS